MMREHNIFATTGEMYQGIYITDGTLTCITIY